MSQPRQRCGGQTGQPAQPAAQRRSRRGFLSTLFTTPLALAWTALTASLGAMLLGTVRFLFPNVRVEPPMRFLAGPASQYQPETVSNKFKQTHGVWIVRSTAYKGRDQIYALVAECTHLGCIPNWQAAERKFKCPCHGSGFDMGGINFEGPAPRPLERCAIRLTPDGQVEVDKSRRFRQELGQWESPDSYIDASLV